MQNSFFDNFTFDHLHHLQVGRIGEYWVKMLLTLAGFDIYTSEVDDKGIDFIVRLDNSRHIDIQVKSVRMEKTNYVFVAKEVWQNLLRENLYLALVLLKNNKFPDVYLIPSIAWEKPNALFVERLYDKEKQSSKPEWGINISKKNLELLTAFTLVEQINKMK